MDVHTGQRGEVVGFVASKLRDAGGAGIRVGLLSGATVEHRR